MFTRPRSRANRRARTLLEAVSVGAALFGVTARAAQSEVSWIGGAAGSWNLAGNWSGGVVPNNGGGQTYNVTIPNASGVVLDLGVLIDNLTLGSTGSLSFQDARPLYVTGNGTLSTLTNAGTVSLLSTGNYTDLALWATNNQVSGGGAIVLQGNARLFANNGTITNQDNTIGGSGYVGAYVTHITNQGTIAANNSGLTLEIDPNATGLNNTGTLQASAGGILGLSGYYGGSFNNAGGTIQAANNSLVNLINGASVLGGTLTTFGNGSIAVVAGHFASLTGLTNAGKFTLQDSASAYLYGAINNTGSINADALNNNTVLAIGGGTETLAGGGTVNLNSGTTVSSKSYLIGSGTLVNSDNTIRGEGFIGNDAIAVVNQGLIRADVSGKGLQLNPNANGLSNSGMLQASGEGILMLEGYNGGQFNNTGRIQAMAGSKVQMYNGVLVLGGTLTTSGDGVIGPVSGHYGGIADLTNAGNVTLPDSSSVNIYGTINNIGSINLNAVNNNTVLAIGGGTETLAGGGTVNLNSGTIASSKAYLVGSGTLINVSNTIRGEGFIGNDAIAVFNHHLISADVANKALLLNPNSNGLQNSGTIQASIGGVLQFDGYNGGGFDNTGGMIKALAGSRVWLYNGATITGGVLSTSGDGLIGPASGHGVSLTALTNAGNFSIVDSAGATLYGAIVNNGSINVNATSNNTVLAVGGGTNMTLSGGGTVNLNSGTTISSKSYLVGSGTLINTDNTIRGEGYIGNDAIAIVNQGLISADVANKGIVLNPNSNAAWNFATLQASGGGVLALEGYNGGVFFNGTGTIRALTGSKVTIYDFASIMGGTLSTEGDGVIGPATGHTGLLTDVTNTGNFSIPDGAAMYLIGTIQNTGSISIEAMDNYTAIWAGGSTVTLSGAGTVNLNSGAIVAKGYIGGSGTLVNDGNTIRGQGQIGLDQIAVINHGTIVASGGWLDLNPAGGGFVNTGLLRAPAGNGLQFNGYNGGGFSGTGSIQIDAGAIATVVNNPSFVAGNILNNGTFSNIVTSNVGRIEGTGTMNVASGTVTADVLRQASFVLAPFSNLVVRPSGTSSAASRVNLLSMQGYNIVDLNDNDLIVDYDSISPYSVIKSQIVTAWDNGARDGYGIKSSMADGKFVGLGYGENSVLAYASFDGFAVDSSAVLVKFTYYGDANLDGMVDIKDLYALALHWQTGADWMGGDFNYDGTVNVADLTCLARNWQAGVGAPMAMPLGSALASLGLPQVDVPEPAMMGVLLVLGICQFRVRRAR